MNDLINLTNQLASLPPGVLLLLVVLAAFGLAAYAIYAVLSVSKGGK